MEYWQAPDVLDIVEKYRKHHPSLVGAKFACIFREKAQTSGGEPIVGKVRKVSDKYKPVMEKNYNYMLEVGADVWQELSKTEREAWVDHLLEHCYGEEDETTGEMTWKTRRPEIVAFTDVLDRHGVDWNDNLKQLKKVDLDDSVSGNVKKNSSGGDEEDEDNQNGKKIDDNHDKDFDDMIDNL